MRYLTSEEKQEELKRMAEVRDCITKGPCKHCRAVAEELQKLLSARAIERSEHDNREGAK